MIKIAKTRGSRSHHMHGIDVLGASASTVSETHTDVMPASRIVVTPISETWTATSPEVAAQQVAQQAQLQQQIDKAKDMGLRVQPVPVQQVPMDVSDDEARRHMLYLCLIFGGSAVLSGTAVAALWTSHRVLGFLLGSLLVGPMLGGTGAAIYMSQVAPKKTA